MIGKACFYLTRVFLAKVAWSASRTPGRGGAPSPFFRCIALLPFEFGRLVVRYESADLLVRTAVSLMAIVPSGLLMGLASRLA
jgi:hypothetical protein